jgi:hypothetical protein
LHTPPEIDDAARYRRISAAAVCALLLGIASLMAFIGPAFFIFPVAAVGLALVALANIKASDGALTGAGLARRAIGLAVAFTVAALARDAVRDNLLETQAADAAQQWVQLLADHQIDDARALLSGDGAGSLAPPTTSESPPPAEQREALILERLRSDELTRAAAASKSLSVYSTSNPTFEGARTVVTCTLMIGSPEDKERRPVVIQLSRYPAYERTASPWHVDRWNLQPPEPPEAGK